MVVFAAVLSFTLFFSSSCALHIPSSGSSHSARDLQSTYTPIGTARGVTTIPGVTRYAVKYASASRWNPSSLMTSWQYPNGNQDASGLPLACPQINMAPSGYSEDCLSMVLYVPTTLCSSSDAPTLLWIPGGSFIIGSATSSVLDGSKLALATNSIVVVIQHRLGALGFLAPAGGQTNLAVRDVVTGLRFLRRVISSFGGSPNKITIAGQSSGANMVRALLAVPSADSLFQSAIIQSDPMDYGFLSTNTQQLLLNYFTSKLGCAGGPCADSVSIDAILNAQMDLFSNAISIDPSAGQGEPIRPVYDGNLITTTLTTLSFPNVYKPLLITNVRTEAGPPIYMSFPSPLPQGAFYPIVNFTFGTQRTDTIVSSPFYQPSTPDADARGQLEPLGTDYLYKCSSWTFARRWIAHGGSAYVGLYTLGATHPDNAQIPFCTQPGSVCHQDDLPIVFGTASNPTPAQVSLTGEVQRRYKAFLSNGRPNAPGLPTWRSATSTDVRALNIGGSGEMPAGACDPSFWGAAVQYDYQVFGL